MTFGLTEGGEIGEDVEIVFRIVGVLEEGVVGGAVDSDCHRGGVREDPVTHFHQEVERVRAGRVEV